MVVSFIKKQLEGLKSEEEIAHLLRLANPDLTDNRIQRLIDDAKRYAKIPIVDEKTVTTIRNAAKDGDHTFEAMEKALPHASTEERMQARNILYAERNEDLFKIINPSILNRTVSRVDGKLQVKNVGSVMHNFRMANSHAEPQSVGMAIKNFEKVRTTRPYKAGGQIESLNPIAMFARPVVRHPKWTASFNAYQQDLQNTQMLSGMIPHGSSKPFKFYNKGGNVPSFAKGSWVNPSLQRSAQQSVLKLSQMRSVAKLQQLRQQAQHKQESHAVLQQRIAESTQRLLAMRRSAQSRYHASQPNYNQLMNPSINLYDKNQHAETVRIDRVTRQVSNSLRDYTRLNPQRPTAVINRDVKAGMLHMDNVAPARPVIPPRSLAALVPNVRFDVNHPHANDSVLDTNMFNVDTGSRVSHANIIHDVGNIYTLGGNFANSSISPDQRPTYISQHVLGMVNLLSQNIPTGEAARFNIPVKDDVDVEKLLAHGFQVSPHRDDTLIKDFVGLKPPAVITVPQAPAPAASTPRISVPRTSTPRVSPTSNMAQVPSNLDANTVRKMLDPFTVGDTRERGFRLIHFKPGDQVDPAILKYIYDISKPVMDAESRSLNQQGATGSSFAIGNINTVYNNLGSSQNIMQNSGLVTALYEDSLELMSALRYSQHRSNSTYVDYFGTRGTVRGKGVGSQVFVEAMRHAHAQGVTDFSLTPLSYPETLRFYRKHGMDRHHQFDLATHVPRLLQEQENFKYVSVDKQLDGIHGNSRSTDAISRNINDVVLRNLKTRFSHAQGGSIPSFMSGGDPEDNLNLDEILNDIVSAEQPRSKYSDIRENAVDNIRRMKNLYGMNKSKALQFYKGTMYDLINKYVETGEVPDYFAFENRNVALAKLQVANAVPFLDQATTEHGTPQSTLYKGLSEYWSKFIDGKEIGDIVTFPGFLSTSRDINVAQRHNRNGLATIFADKNTRGYDFFKSNDNWDAMNESEFLLPRGQSFKIENIHKNGSSPRYTLRHLMEQKVLGGLIPSFESGGPQSIYNMNDASMLTSLLSPDQVDHSAKVMAHASHIWSMMNGSDKGHTILQNAASLHDIGKTIDPKSHGKLAGKFGSLLGIDKISKFLINNHSGTRQPSLRDFKKSKRSDINKMLGALRLADVSARVGTLPLSMKKGSLKLGNTRGLDINKHQLQRIKSSLKMINRMNGGSLQQFNDGGIPALVSAKEAYLPPSLVGTLGSGRLDRLRSMADDSTLMNDIPQLQSLFGGVPNISGAGIFTGGSGNPTADDIFTRLSPGSYILDYQTLQAMKALNPQSVNVGGSISGYPINRAGGGIVGFAAGGRFDRAKKVASSMYGAFKYPYQSEQNILGSSINLQTRGYGTTQGGVFSPDRGVDRDNWDAIQNYQTDIEDWAVNTFSHLDPEEAKKRVSLKRRENVKMVKKAGGGGSTVDVEERRQTLTPNVVFDSKDLEKLGVTAEDVTDSFKSMTENAMKNPMGDYLKTLNLGMVETEKHSKNVALEFTAWGKFASHFKDLSFRLASVSMAAMGVNFSTMAVFQTITNGISQMAAPFNDLEGLMQNVGYLKAFGAAAGVPIEAVNELTSDTAGLVDTWKKVGGITAYMQLSFADLGKELFSDEELLSTFSDSIYQIFEALKEKETLQAFTDLLKTMAGSLPVMAGVIKEVAGALKLFADQPALMSLMMYATVFSMLLQPIFSMGSALLSIVGIGAGVVNWSRGAVVAIKSLNVAFLGLNTTLGASVLYLLLAALAIEGIVRAYELLSGTQTPDWMKPVSFVIGSVGKAVGARLGDDFVEGEGTTTSDDIPYMLSRGERVIPARLNAINYAKYEALETAATGEDFVGGSPNVTDYRYYEGIKSVTSVDTLKAGQDTADTLTAARDGNAIRVIVKNAKDIGVSDDELSNQDNGWQSPFTGGTPQLARILNPGQGIKIFDIFKKVSDLRPDWMKPDNKVDLRPDEKLDIKPDEKVDLKVDEDWKPDERFFNKQDIPKVEPGKFSVFTDRFKGIGDALAKVAPDFKPNTVTKGNIAKSVIGDFGPLKTGTSVLGYASPLDPFSLLNIVNAGRFGAGATAAETVNQTIGGAITGLGVAGSLVGGGALKAAGYAKLGGAIAIPGQIASKAALPLMAATPFLIGAEGAMANRRFMAGESLEDIKMTPFDKLSTAEQAATVLTGGIGTSATANGLEVLVGMYGEDAARTSLTATQQGIDAIVNMLPQNVLNKGLSAVGAPSIGEIGVGGAMALVGLPESISDFAQAVAGLPGFISDLMKPENTGDAATGSVIQSYDEMNQRINVGSMKYVGKTDEVAQAVQQYQQQQAAMQQQQNTFIINANNQEDGARVQQIITDALRAAGFYDSQRA